ncbi:MAG: hypothetical protein MN733_35700, partial [Nitrososphaera sp.]|nr:hypothetical protein [Nitrososphaera sp.]
MRSKFGKAICFSALFLSGGVSAEHNGTCHLPEGPLVLYGDLVSQGWNTEWSWGGNMTPWITNSSPGGQGGTHALRAQVAAPAGGGLEIHTDFGKTVNTAGRSALSFMLRHVQQVLPFHLQYRVY